MAEPSITCPNCGKLIPLTKALTEQIEEGLKRRYEAQSREQAEQLNAQYQKRLTAETVRAQEEAKKKAQEAVAVELTGLRQQAEEQKNRLAEAQKKELDFLKRQRAVDEKERELELQIARTLEEERGKIRQQVAREIDEQRQLKDIEKDKQLADMKRQVDELKRKLEQGSQQNQGEAVEVELEKMLAITFPADQIEPVGKGVRGADVLQRVMTPGGQYCGTIIWESKNTRNWSDGWIGKLRDDQRGAKADVAVLASAALPKTVAHVGLVEGVWVTDFPSAMGLAAALRRGLTDVALTKLAAVGKNEKMEILYAYLSGNEFRQRVEGMMESFHEMRKDLAQERAVMERQWAKREKQLNTFVGSVAGMYGDMQGIIGTTLPRIEQLELPPPA